MRKSLFGLCLTILALFVVPLSDAQEFEKATFQENLTVIYDQKLSNSIIMSVGFETTNNAEIRFSDEVIKKVNEQADIKSIVFTNAGNCVVGVTSEQQCIMINFDYERLKGDGGIRMVQDSARDMGNLLIDDLNQIFRTDAEFHSTFIHTVDDTNTLLETSGVISGRGAVSATFVTDKRATDFLFTDLSGILISKEIREGEGFYEIMKKLSKNDNSIISISMIPYNEENLYMFKVTNEIKEESGEIRKINILEEIGINEISRSKIFDNRNVPLNSIIQLVIIPNEPTQISGITTHAITDLTSLENIMKKGWFLNSPAGNMIDIRFLFGTDDKISGNELVVETKPWDMQSEITIYSVEEIPKEEIPKEEIVEKNNEVSNGEDETQYAILGIIIAIGIGAAIFYLKGYKPKH
tara:strand:- start:1730 stop:2959 length:1230 start_codon:yes stop_codon:yes gene_type:complete